MFNALAKTTRKQQFERGSGQFLPHFPESIVALGMRYEEVEGEPEPTLVYR